MNNRQDTELKEQAAHASDSSSDIAIRRPRGGKRGFPVFYTIYFSFIALFVIAVVIGLNFLHGILSEYEDVQPKYAAEAIYTEHFATPDISHLMDISGAEYTTFESEEAVVKYLGEQLEGKTITYAESSVKGDSNTRSYNVFCDGTRFSIFTLRESAQKTEHGFTTWELDSVRLTFSLPGNSYDFLIPEGYVLTANGTPVPEKYIAGESVLTDAYKLTEGTAGVKYIPYTVSGFLSVPTFEVKDAEGNAATLTYNEDSKISTVGAGRITVIMPEGYTAYIGETAVTEQFKTQDAAEASVFNEFLRSDVAGINYVKYVVEGFIDIPEIKVKNAQGAESRVIYDEGAVTFEALPVYDAQLRTDNEAWILKGFETITLYLQNVAGSKADMRAYFDTASEAWKGYNSINPNWNFEALTYTFEDESVDEFISYDADHFSCRVRLHYIGRRKSATYQETTDKIVFFRRSGDKFLIYNVSNTEALSGLGVER